jgi:hypothetical protein
VFLSTHLFAHADNSAISGTASHASGASVAFAWGTLAGVNTGFVRKATADSRGDSTSPQLSPNARSAIPPSPPKWYRSVLLGAI